MVCNDANIKYQWQHKRDGVPTDLENNNPHYDKVDELKLTVKNAQEEQAGDYFCKVENLAGYSTTSEYFHVTVRLGELLWYCTHHSIIIPLHIRVSNEMVVSVS